jgi:fructose-1,6-bisphosphatase/inositol monophosphatase family enzyme
MNAGQLERARRLLCSLGSLIRDAIVAARRPGSRSFASVSGVTPADTIYAVDRISEAVIRGWFESSWPGGWPVELVFEGIEGTDGITFPRGTPVGMTVLKCIIDPIDGTRNLMHDKRSAWVLAGLAPQKGPQTHLGDLVVAAMTEVPTSRQWRSDQVSAIRGCGPSGIVATAMDVRFPARRGWKFKLRPSQATNCLHGFASLVRFFPEGKALTASIEESLWNILHGSGTRGSIPIFEDQNITTGGQLYGLMAGHDCMVGDIRPVVFAGMPSSSARSLVCHPYDICTALILQEAGGVVVDPEGAPLSAPLDTTSPVAWVGYANKALARQIGPALRKAIRANMPAVRSASRRARIRI